MYVGREHSVNHTSCPRVWYHCSVRTPGGNASSHYAPPDALRSGHEGQEMLTILSETDFEAFTMDGVTLHDHALRLDPATAPVAATSRAPYTGCASCHSSRTPRACNSA